MQKDTSPKVLSRLCSLLDECANDVRHDIDSAVPQSLLLELVSARLPRDPTDRLVYFGQERDALLRTIWLFRVSDRTLHAEVARLKRRLRTTDSGYVQTGPCRSPQVPAAARCNETPSRLSRSCFAEPRGKRRLRSDGVIHGFRRNERLAQTLRESEVVPHKRLAQGKGTCSQNDMRQPPKPTLAKGADRNGENNVPQRKKAILSSSAAENSSELEEAVQEIERKISRNESKRHPRMSSSKTVELELDEEADDTAISDGDRHSSEDTPGRANENTHVVLNLQLDDDNNTNARRGNPPVVEYSASVEAEVLASVGNTLGKKGEEDPSSAIESFIIEAMRNEARESESDAHNRTEDEEERTETPSFGRWGWGRREFKFS